MKYGLFLFLIVLNFSCGPSNEERGEALYDTHCAACHMAPKIEQLPKNLWKDKVLPEMAARMGIREVGFDPLKGLSFTEQEAILKTGIYSLPPQLTNEDWLVLKAYILNMAPDSVSNPIEAKANHPLTQFVSKPLSLDEAKGSNISYLKYDSIAKLLVLGDADGRLLNYDFEKDTVISKGRFGSPLVDYSIREDKEYMTTIGFIDPSALSSGRIGIRDSNGGAFIPENLHRPVHTLVEDLNGDGTDELVVSEYGDLVGSLSLFVGNRNSGFEKKILLNQPGTIRVVAEDMDNDGKKDLVAITAQGDEGISILYQGDNLQFRHEKAIRFSPVFGSSWFELVDFDTDGDKDIITVNGDNADDTYVQKPYHGMRLHINNGRNEFEERYFHPLNGATRVIAKDFDKDGDIDIALLSTFPDYINHPEFSFVYLENNGGDGFNFTPFTCNDSVLGKWFLMDSGDVDNDGDEDIILSAYTKAFAPMPEGLNQKFEERNIDILILENTYSDNF